MPPRKASGGRPGPAKQQSTLSFNHRVTKNVPKSTKDSVLSSSVTKKKAALPEEKVQPPSPAEAEPVEIEPEAEEEDEVEVPQKTDAELRAERVTDAQVRRYWDGLEAQRKAKRVHQEDLSLSEKVLRYFDVSSQYGVCHSPHPPPYHL
jgi:DNA polymerase delta subunit 4